MQNKIRDGRSIDIVPTTDVEGGSVVVLPGMVAVASTDIPKGALGACEVDGVFELPKGSGAIAQGAAVYWKGGECVPASSDGAVFVGMAWEKAEANANTVCVRINFGSK